MMDSGSEGDFQNCGVFAENEKERGKLKSKLDIIEPLLTDHILQK